MSKGIPLVAILFIVGILLSSNANSVDPVRSQNKDAANQWKAQLRAHVLNGALMRRDITKQPPRGNATITIKRFQAEHSLVEHGKMAVSLHLIYTWPDSHLPTWQPRDYHGVDSLNIGLDKIWAPLIQDIRTANGDYGADCFAKITHLQILHNGQVRAVGHLKTFLECAEDFSDFPSESAKCTTNLWAYGRQGGHENNYDDDDGEEEEGEGEMANDLWPIHGVHFKLDDTILLPFVLSIDAGLVALGKRAKMVAQMESVKGNFEKAMVNASRFLIKFGTRALRHDLQLDVVPNEGDNFAPNHLQLSIKTHQKAAPIRTSSICAITIATFTSLLFCLFTRSNPQDQFAFAFAHLSIATIVWLFWINCFYTMDRHQQIPAIILFFESTVHLALANSVLITLRHILAKLLFNIYIPYRVVLIVKFVDNFPTGILAKFGRNLGGAAEQIQEEGEDQNGLFVDAERGKVEPKSELDLILLVVYKIACISIMLIFAVHLTMVL